MKTLQFSIDIQAPAQKVWDLLWNPSTYSKWTSSFNPEDPTGGSIQSDWQVGGKTLFLDNAGNGMVSTIKSLHEPYDVVFEHRGNVENGQEDITSEKVKDWAGALEEYHLSESGGVTTLHASVQTEEEWVSMMTDGFNDGLETVKKLAEENID